MKSQSGVPWHTMDPNLVLGARVTNGEPGPLLEQRLRTALAIAHPDQPIIVSGKGESEYMAEFLRRHGHHNVIEEPRATSTNENLENARALAPEARVFTVVTSNFHVLRTRLWAWHLGIPISTVAARTPPRQRPHNYSREVAATPHSAVRIAYRKILHALHWN